MREFYTNFLKVTGFTAGLVGLVAGGAALSQGTSEPAGMSAMTGMSGMAGGLPAMEMLAPEYRERLGKVSPQVLMDVQRLIKGHNRHSEELTLRQVMQEILVDLQGAMAGIATHNGRLAAERARSLANHYIPRGGLVPYLRLDDITDEKLSVLPGMNEAVEGGARALADAAEAGDFTAAAGHLGQVMTACVQCHDIFRGVPGVSPALPAKN